MSVRTWHKTGCSLLLSSTKPNTFLQSGAVRLLPLCFKKLGLWSDSGETGLKLNALSVKEDRNLQKSEGFNLQDTERQEDTVQAAEK